MAGWGAIKNICSRVLQSGLKKKKKTCVSRTYVTWNIYMWDTAAKITHNNMGEQKEKENYKPPSMFSLRGEITSAPCEIQMRNGGDRTARCAHWVPFNRKYISGCR